jgi:putative membrane protein
MSREALSALFAFLHHGAAFTLFAALMVERVLTRGELTVANARRIVGSDLVFGIAAGLVLIFGFARVFWFEKGPGYYFHSATFIAKLASFAIVGLLSIYPTVEFLRWREPLRRGVLPVVPAAKMEKIRTVIRVESVGVMLVIMFAALMARGIGYFG